MRWWPVLVALGCAGEKVTDVPEADADVDADADSDADADADVDDTVLLNFPADCNIVTAIGPGTGESNHLAGVALSPPAGGWPWRADRVKIALSNEAQDVLTCDASRAHTAFVWVLEPSETRPPNDRDADQELSFGTLETDDPVRLLTGALDPPIVLSEGQKLAVAVQFAGTYPDSSCLTACNRNYTELVDFWSNAAARPYDWSYLGDFGIESNLWIFAEGEPVP
ncbi:MAG: hypothetical protein R3F61_33780 [Myxococcota bacterium]